MNLESGRVWLLRPQVRTYTASIVKVPIFLALRSLELRDGTEPSESQLALERQMIENSSNSAATKLWQLAGGAQAVLRLCQSLGMTQTDSAPTLFEPWDGVETSARDQLRLLQALAEPTRALEASASDLLQLMKHTDSAQAWGLRSGVPKSWTVMSKDGWVPVGANDLWTVNSIGLVQGSDTSRYAIAILSSGAPTYAYGRATVNLAAKAIALALPTGRQ